MDGSENRARTEMDGRENRGETECRREGTAERMGQRDGTEARMRCWEEVRAERVRGRP